MTDQQNPFSYAPNAAPAQPQPHYEQQQQQQPAHAQQQQFSYAPQPQQPASPQYQAGAAPVAAQRPSMWAAFGPGRNVFGVVSIAAAAASLVVGIIFMFVNAFAVIGGNYQLVGLFGGMNSFLSIALMLVAAGFGIAGLLSRNPSKWPSIAGTALGISGLISTVFGLMTSALYSIF